MIARIVSGLLAFSQPSLTRSRLATVFKPVYETRGKLASAHALLGMLNIVGNTALFPRHRIGIKDGVAGIRVTIARLTDAARVEY